MGSETDLLIFRIDDSRYALPLENVLKVELAAAVTPLPNAPSVVAGIINVHGRLLPVMDVRRRLGLPSRDMRLDDHLILARTFRRDLLLWVEQVPRVERCSAAAQADADTVLEQLPHFAGITALKDNLVLIHDLEKFLSEDEEKQLTQAMETLSP